MARRNLFGLSLRYIFTTPGGKPASSTYLEPQAPLKKAMSCFDLRTASGRSRISSLAYLNASSRPSASPRLNALSRDGSARTISRASAFGTSTNSQASGTSLINGGSVDGGSPSVVLNFTISSESPLNA